MESHIDRYSHAPRGAPYCADCTYYFRTYLSFVYFLILRFMTYVFLHLAATLCTPLAYYLAYPHVSLFPPSVKILLLFLLITTSHFSLLSNLRQWSTGIVLQLESHLQLFYHSILRETHIGIHQTWKCHYVAHVIDRFIAFLRNAFVHIMSPSFFDHSVNQAEPVCCE